MDGARVAERPIHPYPPWLLERANDVQVGMGNLRKEDNPLEVQYLANEFLEKSYKNLLECRHTLHASCTGYIWTGGRHYTTLHGLPTKRSGVVRAGYDQTGKRNFRSVPCSDRLQSVSYIYTAIPSKNLFFNIPVTVHLPASRPPRCVRKICSGLRQVFTFM